MATTTDTKTTSTSTSADSSVEPSSGGSSLASTDGGTTTIDQAVVSKIASIAVREVDGVHHLGGAISGAVASVVKRIRGDEHGTAGVGVEVGTRQAAVDITMVAEYPVPLQELTRSVRDNVTSRIESLTGLEVVEVNIVVTDLFFPGDENEQADGTSPRVE